MRRVVFCVLSGLAALLLCATAAFAGKLNAADYPLRVHIFSDNGRSHYYYAYRRSEGALTSVDGEGRANLYENGMPEAFDFSYRCRVHLMSSMGFETYMARWKKHGSSLELLLPDMGHPDKADLCEVQVTMKDGVAYYRHNALIGEEPAADFKRWMEKHQYDPEHGLNEPIQTTPQPAAPAPPATPAPQQ